MRALRDLGAIGSALVPPGVALLLHCVELHVGAKARHPAQPQQFTEGLPDRRRHPLATVRNEADLDSSAAATVDAQNCASRVWTAKSLNDGPGSTGTALV